MKTIGLRYVSQIGFGLKKDYNQGLALIMLVKTITTVSNIILLLIYAVHEISFFRIVLSSA